MCSDQNGPSDPSAARVVPGDCVDGQFDVQITASGTGLGQIKETLCDGWTYVGSTMDPDQVSVSGNTVTFTVFSFPQTFTYTVQAPATPGATCTISGIVKDTVNTAGVPIAGQQVSVCIPIEGILLEEGWNLFSVPCVLENDTVEYVLEGVDYDAIVWYDASDQTWYIAVDIVPMTAYAIIVNETQTIENIECISEPIVPPTRHMYPGWNLVGLTSFDTTKKAESTFIAGGIDDSYSRVWGPWDGTQFVQLGYNKNVLDPVVLSGKDVYTESYIIKPYEGHWIFMEQDDTLVAIGP